MQVSDLEVAVSRDSGESPLFSARRLQAILDATRDALVLLDQNLHVLYISPFHLASLGMRAEEVIGSSVWNIPIHPEDLAGVQETLENALHNSGKEYYREFRLRDAVGVYFWAEALLYNQLHDPDVQAILVHVRDIRERKAMEDALRASEERAWHLFEALPIGVAIVRNDGAPRVNTAYREMLGYTRDEPLHDFLEVIHPEEREEAKRLLTELVEGKRNSYRVERRYIRRDGQPVTADLSVCALEGSTVGQRVILIAAQDITKRKLYEEQLDSLNKELAQKISQHAAEMSRLHSELQQLVYSVSHDLQEPARTVTNYVQLLERRYKEKLDASAQEFIAFAVDAAKRMQELLGGLLAFSRVETRGTPFEEVDANALLENALFQLRKPIAETEATITHDPLPMIVADASQIEQLFVYLLDNALKFRSEAPPKVHVTVQEDPTEWQFAVADNGIGIEKEHFERIFVMFQRLYTREEYPGIGAGLAISKRIVERHGGRIRVESEPGKGTTILFTLPKNPKPSSGVA